MRLSHVSAVLVLLPVLAFAREEPNRAKVEEPEGVFGVDSVYLVGVNDRFVGFNEGRRYAVSINEHLPDAKVSRAKLARLLKEQKQLDQVVFEWFGKETPKRLNIVIGDKVPVQIAQAAIAAYAVDAKVPVYIVLKSDDENVGRTYRIFLGSLVDFGNDPLKPEQLRELVKPDLSQERFTELLSKK